MIYIKSIFTFHTSLMVIMLCFFYQVRMAERSKAPDSRFTFSVDDRDYREFWSSYEGVGSNPTSDKTFFKRKCFILFILDSIGEQK